MKLRIQDSSFRFRITLKELEELVAMGRIERHAEVPGPDGAVMGFHYAIVQEPNAAGSCLRVEAFGVVLALAGPDLKSLCEPNREGVYIRREWVDRTGVTRRSMAFVEKDRPASVCDKPEAWIYQEGRVGEKAETRPIPASRAKEEG